jgi:hypothetical protein
VKEIKKLVERVKEKSARTIFGGDLFWEAWGCILEPLESEGLETTQLQERAGYLGKPVVR